MLRIHLFAALVSSVTIPSAISAEIVDERFGFRFDVPGGFTRAPVESGDDSILYKFLDREADAGEASAIILIQRLKFLVDPTQRLKAEALEEMPGAQATLEERTWNGVALDVLVQDVKHPQGAGVSYSTQFPLAQEAVQIAVIGPEDRSDWIAEVFATAVDSFHNTRPLYTGGQVARTPAQPLPQPVEPLAFPWAGLAVFGLMILLLVSIVGRWIRAIKRKGRPEGA